MDVRNRSFRVVLCAGGAMLVVAAATSARCQQQVAENTASAAGAAKAASSAPTQIDEVVVTATKRAEKLQNVPISITVSRAADLQRRGATQIQDIVAMTPGLSNSGDGPNQANLVVRGVTTGASIGLQQSTVALFVDDLPTDPGAGALGTTDLRLFDVERVEVLRGPQGTLFGSGSLSGAVRILNNKPDFDAVHGAVEATASGTLGGNPSGDVNAMLNIPIVEGKLAFRMVGYASDSGGYINNVLTGRSDVNWDRQFGGRLMIGLNPTDRLKLLFTAIYQNNQPGSDGSSTYSPTAGLSNGTRTESTLVEAVNKLQNTVYNFVGEYDFGPVTLTSSTSYSERRLLAVGNASGYTLLVGDELGVPGVVESTPSYTPSNSGTITQELRLASNGAGRLRWTTGIYYQTLAGNGGFYVNSNAIAGLTGVSVLANLSTNTPEEEEALFGEATYALTENLDLTAGARLARTALSFSTKATGVLMTGSFSPDVLTSNGSQAETSVDPRFAITYHPNSDLTIYAQASRGFRTGGPNLTAGLSPTPPPSTYKSDSLWNYEVGERVRLLDDRLRLNGTIYYIDWSNIQASLYRGIAYTGNAGDAQIYGFEGEADILPTRWLELGTSLSLNHGALTKNVSDLYRVSGLIGVSAGDSLPASPEIKVSSYAQASFQLAGHDSYIRLDHQYIGKESSDFGGQGAQYGNYNVVNLRAGVKLNGVEIAAFANNLLNGSGKVSAFDPVYVSGVPLDPKVAIRLRPLTLGLTTRAHF